MGDAAENERLILARQHRRSIMALKPGDLLGTRQWVCGSAGGGTGRAAAQGASGPAEHPVPRGVVC